MLFRKGGEWFYVGNLAGWGYFQELSATGAAFAVWEEGFFEVLAKKSMRSHCLCVQRPDSFSCWMAFYSLCISPLQHVR